MITKVNNCKKRERKREKERERERKREKEREGERKREKERKKERERLIKSYPFPLIAKMVRRPSSMSETLKHRCWMTFMKIV
jgi:hypothetical protein